MDLPEIDALLRITPQLYSGGEPAGAAAFKALARLGVRTVVSVDAALPAADLARRHGIDTVHIPIGYDGVDSEATLALTAVARNRPGPYFIHCHHGVHRGPAAAAIVGRALGVLDAPGGARVLEMAGTSEQYVGLWRDVAQFEVPSAAVTLPRLVAAHAAPDLARAMAALDRTYDRVREVKAAGWVTPRDHPDIEPAHEGWLFWQAVREAKRTLPPEAPPTLREEFELAESAARAFRDAWSTDGEEINSDEITARWEAVEASCRSCHRTFRD